MGIPEPPGGWRPGTVVDCDHCGRRLAEITEAGAGQPTLTVTAGFQGKRCPKCKSTMLRITVPARTMQ